LKVTLTPRAAERLGVTTVPVSHGPASTLVVPYSAIVYDSAGVPWVYAVPARLTYVRQRVAVKRIEGPTATLSNGPPFGTPVVSQGAIEIYGAELGVGQ
jgi:hypothetical protein